MIPLNNDTTKRNLQGTGNALLIEARALKSKLFFALITAVAALTFALISYPAHAQDSAESAKLSAVLSIINGYILDFEAVTEVDLVINQVDGLTYSITDTFEIEIPRANLDIEFCFVLSSFDPNLRMTINGNNETLTVGENCFFLTTGEQNNINVVQFSFASGQGYSVLSLASVSTSDPSLAQLSSLTRSQWDGRAVRKVLKIFAFGGHATDAQINLWANMRPRDAIQEMLNFNQHNLRLSPMVSNEKYRATTSAHGTLTAFQNFISDTTSYIPIPADRRDQYGLDGYNFDDAFNRMITVRGMNPFRQRIGFWETNYHLSTNLDSSVSRAQMATYYDRIMAAHEAGWAYRNVIGIAAKSAAAAMQYGHRNNEWDEQAQECDCNEDFAREIHQLYYGIFGENDPDHENVTIPETAKMLTGMPVPYINNFGFSLQVDFQKGLADAEHHLGPVNILGRSIQGASASEKIDNLMPISMQHPESLKNLPIMIISVLADDNLNEARKNQLRASWAALGVNRKLLDFIHAYAISDMFHSPNQFKYLTTHERALYIANKNNLDNLEAYFGGANYDGGRAGRTIGSIISDDFAGDFFRPVHNVFGGQTSSEASDSALAFENNYNRLTDDEHHLRDAVACDNCDLGQPWQKKWETVLPRGAGGNYYVSDVAEWLWMHAVGNMDNYTELERAHLYSLLGAARNDLGSSSDGDHAFDFNLVMCVVADHAYNPEGISPSATITDILATNRWNDFCRQNDDNTTGFLPHELAELNATYTGDQIANDPQIQAILAELGNQTIPLNVSGSQHDDNGARLRKHARERVSSALGFIFTTPFIFAEGQQ